MDTLALKKLKVEVENICQKAGKIITTGAKQRTFEIDTKTFNNLVTEIDKNTELFLVEHLGKLLPDSGFIAEEGTGEKSNTGLNWIIDPLDGTTNFIHQIPAYCISVALANAEDEIVLGVIYDPTHNEMFSAHIGGGAFLNGAKINTSNTPQLIDCLLATGFPYDDFKQEDTYFTILKKLTHHSRGLRRLGSAAIDLAYVACGRFDAFYEYGLNPWDVAAGIIIVKEAGGNCTDFKGGSNMLYGEQILATNPNIYDEIFEHIAPHFK